MIATQPFEVLLVEDDPADVLITREVFAGSTLHALNVVADGVEAMAYLRREGQYGQAQRPN
ncbi:MAG: hypothetical protein L0Y54_16300 [Sporichthyaceae bacterium]|nr:hypothetical protein [Sporichthyaceae bacterium]